MIGKSREEALERRLSDLGEDQRGTREHVDLLNKLAEEIVFSQSARSLELAGQAEALSRAVSQWLQRLEGMKK